MTTAVAAKSRSFSLAAFFAGWREAMLRDRVYRQTVKELSRLSDRELADIGIHRSMISQVAYDGAHGR